MDQNGVDSMVSTAYIGMNRELTALQQTDLSKMFENIIATLAQTRQKLIQYDDSLKTGINTHNMIIAYHSKPTFPDDTALKSLEDELKHLHASLDKIIENIQTLKKDRAALADERAKYRAEQTNKQRKDRQKLAEMRSLLGLYQTISNVHWDADHRCFFLSSQEAKLINFSTPDDNFKLSQKDKSGKNMCIWDLLNY